VGEDVDGMNECGDMRDLISMEDAGRMKVETMNTAFAHIHSPASVLPTSRPLLPIRHVIVVVDGVTRHSLSTSKPVSAVHRQSRFVYHSQPPLRPPPSPWWPTSLRQITLMADPPPPTRTLPSHLVAAHTLKGSLTAAPRVGNVAFNDRGQGVLLSNREVVVFVSDFKVAVVDLLD
jgi:hypothetical protein